MTLSISMNNIIKEVIIVLLAILSAFIIGHCIYHTSITVNASDQEIVSPITWQSDSTWEKGW